MNLFNMTQKYNLTFGLLVRKTMINRIRQFLDSLKDQKITYELCEYKSWLESDYSLSIHGPIEVVQLTCGEFDKWLEEIKGE